MSDSVELQITRAGKAAGMHDPTDLLAHVEAATIEKDAAGTVLGLEKTIAALRESKPTLFRRVVDPDRPIGPQLQEMAIAAGRDRAQDPLRKLVSDLDVSRLTSAEFDDLVELHKNSSVDIMARSRLEAAAKRQADERAANRPHLTI